MTYHLLESFPTYQLAFQHQASEGKIRQQEAAAEMEVCLSLLGLSCGGFLSYLTSGDSYRVFLWLQPHSKPTVTWEDQQNINKFSNAFQRQGELQGLIQNQKVVFP